MKNLFYNFQDNISTHFPRWPEIHLCTDRKIVRKNKMLIAVLETDWVLVVSNRRGGAEEGEGAPVKLWWISRGQSNRTQDAAVREFWSLNQDKQNNKYQQKPIRHYLIFSLQPQLQSASSNDQFCFHITAKTWLGSCESRSCFSGTVGLKAPPHTLL